MKIGILTFHRAHNYGAVLQAYALQEYIKSLGYDVEIIDYRAVEICRAHDLFKTKDFLARSITGKILHLFTFIFFIRKRIIRNLNFNKFINSLHLSKCVYGEKTINIKGYEYIFFGSDQIWNPSIFKGFNRIYTGQFEKGKSIFITYAASAGMTSKLDDLKCEFNELIGNFDYVSVREKSLQMYIQSLKNEKVEIVLDPIFLLNIKELNKILIEPIHTKPYVLIYQVKRDNRVNILAEKIASENNWDVVEVTCEVLTKSKFYTNQTAHPLEFVGLIKSAEFIVTTSFHGTSFAILLNKPFYSIMFNTSNDERSKSLLDALSLNERALVIGDYKSYTSIDYTNINLRLDELTNKSQSFIKSCLKTK